MPISGISQGLGLGGAATATISGAPSGGSTFFNVYAASLDGTDDHLFFGSSATDKDITLGTTDFALSMWFYPTSTSQDFLFQDASAADRTFIHGGTLTLKGYGASNVVIASAYSINNWYHLVVTRTSGTEKVYINAVEKNSRSESGTFKVASFGYRSAGYYFLGEMDEISFHSAGLSSGQVSSMYNGGSPIDITSGYNATGWWRMGDDASGASINDQIGSETLTASGANLNDTNVPT